MSTMCPPEFEKNVLKWLLKCLEKNKPIDFVDLKNLTESIGFSAAIETKPKDNQENVDPEANTQYLTITKVIKQVKSPEKQEPKSECIKDPPQNPVEQIKSPIFSPHKEPDLSLIIATSSPIKQINKVSDKLTTIIKLAKEALESSTDGINPYGKPFMNKRISDIKISPLALSEQPVQQPELNITMTKDVPSVLKVTPKKKTISITKPEEKKLTPSAIKSTNDRNSNSNSIRKTLLQPVQSKFQSLSSKLRTPTNIKAPSPSVTKSAGLRTNLTPNSNLTDRRMSVTPTGISRLRHPTSHRKQ